MWRAIMPTLGLPGGVKLAAVRADYKRSLTPDGDPDAFLRERLGIWTDDARECIMTDAQMDWAIGDHTDVDVFA